MANDWSTEGVELFHEDSDNYEEVKDTFVDVREVSVQISERENSSKLPGKLQSFGCEDITCSYKTKDGGSKQVLHGISMEIKRKQMMAIIGKSKCHACLVFLNAHSFAPNHTKPIKIALDRSEWMRENLLFGHPRSAENHWRHQRALLCRQKSYNSG